MATNTGYVRGDFSSFCGVTNVLCGACWCFDRFRVCSCKCRSQQKENWDEGSLRCTLSMHEHTQMRAHIRMFLSIMLNIARSLVRAQEASPRQANGSRWWHTGKHVRVDFPVHVLQANRQECNPPLSICSQTWFLKHHRCPSSSSGLARSRTGHLRLAAHLLHELVVKSCIGQHAMLCQSCPKWPSSFEGKKNRLAG